MVTQTNKAKSNDSLKDYWIADSGATAHMCNRQEWFTSLKALETPETVNVGDNGKLLVTGIGEVEMYSCANDEQRLIKLKNVLLVPGLATNLISIGQAEDSNIKVVFWKGQVSFILQGNDVVAAGSKLSGSLYIMKVVPAKTNDCAAYLCQVERTLSDWHRTLGHAGKERILKLLKSNDLKVKSRSQDTDEDCSDCPVGKAKHISHPSKDHRAMTLGDEVYVDLAGPISTNCASGSRYYLLCKDAWSTYTYLYLIQDKTQVSLALAKLLAQFEIETGSTIKRICSDQGSEFLNKKTEILFASERVLHQTSAAYCPQQNGMIERERDTNH